MSTADAIVGLGTRADFVAVVPNLDLSRMKLNTEERAVLIAVGKVSSIGEILAKVGLSEPRAIATLLALRAKGVITPARVTKPEGPAVTVTAAAAEVVDLDEARKQEILELERGLDGKSHYALLGIPVGAGAAEVKRAFHDLSLRYHPDRFFNKNLGSYRARIERIFRRITEANAVLSDEAKRTAYLKAHPELTAARAPEPGASPSALPSTELDPERMAERRARMARHPYLAKARHTSDTVAEARSLIEKQEYARAISVLNGLAQLDPRNKDVPQLLQTARTRYEAQRATQEVDKGREAEARGDLPGALSAYRIAIELDSTLAAPHARAAVLAVQLGEDIQAGLKLAARASELEPRSAAFHALYGRLALDAGNKKLARKEFEDAVRLDPDHPEAKAQLRKMKWSF